MPRKNKIKEYYDSNYFKERDYLPEHLLEVLISNLKSNNVRSILEVGVGSGRLMNALRKEGFRVKGIDISPISVKLTGAKLASATDIPFGADKFDCVIGISIIEHLNKKDGIKFIHESKRVLKNNGILFLVTPNYASPLRLIQGEKWFAYKDKSHIYFYSPTSLKDLLVKNSFVEIRTKFKTNTSSIEWPLPSIVHKFPSLVRLLINRLLISSFIANHRDSFWISGKLKNES